MLLRLLPALLLASTACAKVFELTAEPQGRAAQEIADVDPNADCFSIEFTVDPVVAEEGDFQVVSGVMVGLPSSEAPREEAALLVDLREGGKLAHFTVWNRKRNLSGRPPDPKTPGWMDNRDYQHSDELSHWPGQGYTVRLIVWPEGEGSHIRLFVESMDRPKLDVAIEERLTAQTVKLATLRGGQKPDPTRTTRFANPRFQTLSLEQAQALPPPWETVLRAIDFSYPGMAPVGEAIQQGKFDTARSLFLRHLRTRREPKGPSLEQVESSVIHPDWQTIADAALRGEYGTTGYFAGIAPSWTDTEGETHSWVLQEEPLQVNWARCNGHLNRHFHWVSLARAYQESGDERYAERFSDEVFDWVTREPFFWDKSPSVGGLNTMDGTQFRWGYMNTSNIGRRLELTWWPAYEVFRSASGFNDEAHFAMLLGMIRQAELITNPSSFAVHDDGAAHTTMALLQTAILLPELKASARWKAMALERWDEMLARQFHPDGTHVSLSTGYSWATILSLENFIRFIEQLGSEPPPKYLAILEKALEHPMYLSTPSQGQISLNDGGWGLVDDAFQRNLRWFPHREDFKWMATKTAEGTPPEKNSIYLPNAGQYFMRTGWGENQQYLFFGAGPWGASHGKQDALNIYAQWGNHLLIRDAGRGSYSGVGNTVHAGRSLSYNTLSPDWAQENSIPHWKQEMHRGFNPQPRRWISNDSFDYGEGVYQYGWHRPGEHIRGTWLRQVLFVKGAEPTRDGYYVVIDTVEPEEDTPRTWRLPWQLNLNPPDIGIRPDDRSVTAISPAVALQILPVDPGGDLELSVIQGQEEPELLGWRIYDQIAKEWPVPTHSWQASGAFSRAWIIQMQESEDTWPVVGVTDIESTAPGQLRFSVQRRDGGIDHFQREHPQPGQPDLQVRQLAADGTPGARLEVDGGSESVAGLLQP